MKVIETSYQGYKFRSRLEARWAVYFGSMDFEYFYEFEGYDLGEAGWYLPDFYLPHVNMWAEVKPTAFSKKELRKLQALVMFTRKPALMLIGMPERRPYRAICLDTICTPNGLYRCDLILSNYHNYYRNERRFYGDPSDGEINNPNFDDIDAGVLAAKSARFQPAQRRQNDTYSRTYPIQARH